MNIDTSIESASQGGYILHNATGTGIQRNTQEMGLPVVVLNPEDISLSGVKPLLHNTTTGVERNASESGQPVVLLNPLDISAASGNTISALTHNTTTGVTRLASESGNPVIVLNSGISPLTHNTTTGVARNASENGAPVVVLNSGISPLIHHEASGVTRDTIEQGQPVVLLNEGATSSDMIDALSNAVKTINYEHAEIHSGDSFMCDIVDISMASADTLNMAFKTPPAASGRIHFIFEWASKAAAHLDLLEAPRWERSTGNTKAVINRFRDSINISNMLVEDVASGSYLASELLQTNVSNITGGTIIHDQYTWGDKKTTSKDRDMNEFILKADTLYAARLTADTGSNAGYIILHWYEHLDRA